MSVTYVGATYDEIANTDSSTVLTQHASTQVHDVIIAIVGVGGDITITPTEESSMGWVTLSDSENDDGGDTTMGIYWTHATVAGAGDTHQFDLSASGNSGRSYLIALRNCSIAGTISDNQIYTSNTTNKANFLPATGDYDNWTMPSWECWSLVVDVADGGSDPAGAGYPSGYTGIYHAESADTTNSAIVGAAYKVETTETSSAGWFTLPQVENSLTAHILIRPHARFEYVTQDNYNLNFALQPSGVKRIRWAVLGPIPQQPPEWCNVIDGGSCRYGLNIEYMMESADSHLSVTYFPDWKKYLGTNSEERDILDEEDAQASPVYTFPVDLYNESYLSSDTSGHKGVEFSPIKTSQTDHVMWLILRIDFTYVHDADETRVFNVMASFIYDDTSQNPSGENPFEYGARSWTAAAPMIEPDYPVSSWHVRDLVMKSMNRLICQALPRICIPVFGSYEAGP